MRIMKLILVQIPTQNIETNPNKEKAPIEEKKEENINNIPNLEIKLTNSDIKLAKKIEELEIKLDNLNKGKLSEEPKEEEKNIYDKYELSDITKAFLDSYTEDSSQKPELSDFSKAYITGLDVDYNIDYEDTKKNERPALSGLTMEFLKDNENTNDDSNKMEKIIEEKEEESN